MSGKQLRELLGDGLGQRLGNMSHMAVRLAELHVGVGVLTRGLRIDNRLQGKRMGFDQTSDRVNGKGRARRVDEGLFAAVA